tara:strand:- start:16752 stop:17831 length:1080 start_codon:yes stop_codon:yes gene_type:complete
MEDFQLSSHNFQVKSTFGNYLVEFASHQIFIDQLDQKKTILVIDKNIYQLYKDSFYNFPDNNILIINSSEKSKSFEYSATLLSDLLNLKIKKDYSLIAIGGGTLQDITAFVASMIYRGIKWSFIPTTLLAQCDSCIGSKTSINFQSYKNVLGNFYPPQQVIIDIKFLDSLPDSEIKSGIGEMTHYFYFEGSNFLEKIFSDYNQLISRKKSILPFVKESLRIKKNVIEIDEFDTGIRNHFQFGHTFGHAIETATNYKINHGQAVTVGMDISMYLSMKKKLMNKKEFLYNHNLIAKNFPKFASNKFDFDLFYNALIKDKKNIENYVVCVLIEKSGLLKKSMIKINNKLKENLKSYFMEYQY